MPHTHTHQALRVWQLQKTKQPQKMRREGKKGFSSDFYERDKKREGNVVLVFLLSVGAQAVRVKVFSFLVALFCFTLTLLTSPKRCMQAGASSQENLCSYLRVYE